MHERDAILKLWRQNTNSALATVVETKGSSYRRAGARMILGENGQSAGLISGGCLDADLWARARQVMENGRAQLAIYNTESSQDIVFGLGLGCRGVVKVLIEPAQDLSWLQNGQALEVGFEGELGTRPIDDFSGHARVVESGRGRAFAQKLEAPQTLLIFGAGADAVPLAHIGQTLGWNVEIIDPRAPHLLRPIHLEARHVLPNDLANLKIPDGAACALMTHNFLHDLEILKRVLPSPARYVGALGPRRRTDELLNQIATATLTPGVKIGAVEMAKLHAPIGLDIGAETPAEIALAIVAEIQLVRSGKSGTKLRERDAIH